MNRPILSPIALFTYNRLSETKQTLEALRKNYMAQQSKLFIFSDGAKNDADWEKVNKVRAYLKTVDGFKNISIVESDNNKGLANSIINGVSQVLKDHDKIIVLEDDLVSSPNFLNYMNQALDFYAKTDAVQSVCAYSLDLKHISGDCYFHARPFSWGWGTWKTYWNKGIFDKNNLKNELQNDPDLINRFKKRYGDNVGKMLLGALNNTNDSWFVRWAFNQFKNNNYSNYPAQSLIKNIGFGMEGTHCKGINPYPTKPMDINKTHFALNAFEVPSDLLNVEFLSHFTTLHKIKIRLKLLRGKEGRAMLFQEFKLKLKP